MTKQYKKRASKRKRYDDEDSTETDIFKRKRPRYPTDEPNQVRMPGRTKADVGAYWDSFIGPAPYSR